MVGFDLAADYSTRQAAQAAGLPEQVVMRLAAAGVIASSVPAAGSGSRRRWTALEVDRLCRLAAVWQSAKDGGLLLTWQAVADIWRSLEQAGDWQLTLVA